MKGWRGTTSGDHHPECIPSPHPNPFRQQPLLGEITFYQARMRKVEQNNLSTPEQTAQLPQKRLVQVRRSAVNLQVWKKMLGYRRGGTGMPRFTAETLGLMSII